MAELHYLSSFDALRIVDVFLLQIKNYCDQCVRRHVKLLHLFSSSKGGSQASSLKDFHISMATDLLNRSKFPIDTVCAHVNSH